MSGVGCRCKRLRVEGIGMRVQVQGLGMIYDSPDELGRFRG